MVLELFTHHHHGFAQSFGIAACGEVQLQHAQHIVPEIGGHALVDPLVADHRGLAITHAYVDQNSVAILGLVHAQFLEHESRMVEHIIFYVIIQVYADLAAGALLGGADRRRNTLAIGRAEEGLGGEDGCHQNLMSGAFSVPSWALKPSFAAKPNMPANMLPGKVWIRTL